MRDPLWGFAPWLHIQPPLCPGLDAPAVLLGFLSLLPRSRLLHLLFLLPAQKLPPRPFRSPPLAQVLLLPEDYPASPPSQQLHPALPAAPPPPQFLLEHPVAFQLIILSVGFSLFSTCLSPRLQGPRLSSLYQVGSSSE